MRRGRVLPLLLLAAGCTGSSPALDWPDERRALAWKATVYSEVGQARHRVKSRLQDQTSRWRSPLGGLRLAVDLRSRSGFEASGEVSSLWTNDETETWTRNSETASRNTLEIQSREARLLLGYGTDVEDIGHLSLLGGLAWRRLEMDRKLPDGDLASCKSGLPFATVEGRASMPLVGWESDPRVSFDTSLSFGWLLEPEAQVEGTAVEGDRGWLLRWRAGFDYELTRRSSLYLGGFVERMDIEGGIRGSAEWPDSRSTAGGFEIGLEVRF